MLTYMEVHLYYTLPMTGLLFLLLRPFHTAQDRLKYTFLCTIAMLTASPWDNYIVYHRAWWYCPSCVTAVIGYVPLEEYMFFVIMSLMTVAFTNLAMRWRLPSVFVKPDTSVAQSMCTRYVPIAFLLTIGVRAWNLAIPDTQLFYGACILWYVCPVLALLWFGAGEYMCRRWQTVLISILVPTAYLCWVDKVAIGAGTWHISLRTSTGKMVLPNLPLEEAMFFTLINTVLVFATCAIDRAQAILHLTKSSRLRSASQQQKQKESVVQQILDLTWAFCLSDQGLDNQQLKDIDVTWRILREASFSFYTASAVFPMNVRQDLGILYGFCRATDDLADDEQVSVEKRKDHLALARQFVQAMFRDKPNQPVMIDWEDFSNLPTCCLAAFRAFTRLRPALEVDAVEELLDGYAWDLQRRPILDDEALVRYSACVASSVGEMCTRVILYNHDSNIADTAVSRWTLERARDMGLVLQFTNIARDIVTDSQQLRRCYVPRTWLCAEEHDAICQGKARQHLGDGRLRELALQLVQVASDLEKRGRRGIHRLPSECQGGVRAACAVYSAIGGALQKAKGYPTRAHVSQAARAWIVLKNVYGFGQTTGIHP
ncbi:phytoene synthase [Syncephalastrum racemosum]|uniref:Bifunctional lycopene cyclase/phytoene synthase n=1 Tax=Syncephalastrum racemosum TaxID=13706 RepID=A0A1X2H2H5_SYNRA|nr:phytoene synthase [Syncephalastrum racemosum]